MTIKLEHKLKYTKYQYDIDQRMRQSFLIHSIQYMHVTLVRVLKVNKIISNTNVITINAVIGRAKRVIYTRKHSRNNIVLLCYSRKLLHSCLSL